MLDIKIKPSYQSLDIGNITINMVSESPLFYAEIAQRSLSYNFTIVATPRNIRLLKIPNIIESNDQFEDFKADLIINKLKETEVDLYIKEVNKDYIKLSLVAVDFDVDFLEENLQQFDFDDEIDLGNDSSEVRTEIKSRNTQSYPDTNFVFPMIYNDQFYEDENSEYLGVINNYDVVGETVVANTDSPVKNKTAIVPYFFLVYILKRIFELNNISLKGSFIEHTEVQKILIHNNFALDQFNLSGKFIRARFTATTGYYMPYTPSAIDRTLIFNDESTFPNEDDDNIYDNTTGEFTIDQTGVAEITLFNFGFVIYSVRYDVLSPLLTIEVHIDGVKRSSWHSWEDINNIAMFKPGVKITFSELKLPSINLTASDIGKKGVIKFGLNYLDLSDPTGIHSTRIASVWAGSIVEISIQSWSDFNILQPITSPNLHMPNMQIKDFVNAYLKGFKIIPHYDPKTQELFFDLFEGVYTNIKYQDISKNIVSESIKRNDEKGVTLNYDFSSDDLFPEKQPDISKFRYIGEYNTPDDLPTPSSVSLLAFVKSSNAYYVSQITSGITFERYRERMDDIVLGDGSEPYLIPYSPFYMDSISIDNDGAGTMRTFLLPKINEVGSSLFYKIGINDPLFKVLIWHGMVDGPVASKPYAFASSYNIDQNSNKIGDLSLILSEDDDSAYVQFLKNYFYFLLNTKRVDHVYTNNFKSPLSYDFTEKKLIVNQRFLTGKLSIKITKNGVDRITAENYKV